MMRLPERIISRNGIDSFIRDVDWVKVWTSGDNLIVDIQRDEVQSGRQ